MRDCHTEVAPNGLLCRVGGLEELFVAFLPFMSPDPIPEMLCVGLCLLAMLSETDLNLPANDLEWYEKMALASTLV